MSEPPYKPQPPGIWNRTVREALERKQIDPAEVQDIIALYTESREQRGPTVADIAEALNAAPEEIAALRGRAHQRHLNRVAIQRRKVLRIGVAVLAALAIVVAIILMPYRRTDQPFTYVRSSPEAVSAKILAVNNSEAAVNAVFDYHPQSLADWLIGPDWSTEREWLNAGASGEQWALESVGTVSTQRLYSLGVIRIERRYRFAMPQSPAPIYISEGVNSGAEKITLSIPVNGPPSPIFAVTQVQVVKQ